MSVLFIRGPSPATLLVEGTQENPVPVLISNVDPVNILYLGDNVSIDPSQQSSVTPLSPGQYVVASGLTNVYAVGASGASVAVNVLPGFTSFFQPITKLIIQGTASGLFLYNGTPAANNLIGSWSSVAGVDQFGNPYPQGVNIQSGSIQGVSLASSSFIAGTILNTLISASQMQGGTITGGTMTETVITFDSSGGGLFMYSTSATTVTFSTPGLANFVGPANVTTLKVQVWGADAGAGGGNTISGGEAGGGGEFAQESVYPNIPGTNYNVAVGAAGTGGTTNVAGTSGGQSSFDNTGVVAGGGQNGTTGVGGIGGNISTNTIHWSGGNGGSNPSNFTSSAGGGGRAGTTGPGGNGGNPTSNAAPGTAGAAGTGTGGIAGGVGVLAGTNGNPGGGGSGAGQGSSGTTYINKFYDATSTASYYGAGVGGGQKNSNGSMYQGCPNSGLNNFPGDTESFANYNHAQIASDFSGATIDSVSLTLNNQHSWYSSGNYLILSYSDGGGDHYLGNTNGVFWTPEGQTSSLNVSAGLNAQIKTLLALKFGPSANSGSATSLWNYGYYQGGVGQGSPRLTVKGHIGTTGLFTAGNGSNGKVIVSYQSANVLVGALSPIVGTDTGGNAFAVGFTGPSQAFHAGSSPATVETWQTISTASGLTGTLRCKKVSEHNMVIIDINVAWSGLTAQTFTLGSLPDSTYYPTVTSPGGSRIYALGHNSTSPAAYAATTIPRLFIPTSGALQVIVPATSAVGLSCSCTVQYPID